MAISIVIIGLISISNALQILSSNTYTVGKCVSRALMYRRAYGLGTYWDVRAFDLYGQSNEKAYQITTQFQVYPWQANLSDYTNKKFTFLFVDKSISTTDPTPIMPNNIYIPPNPTNIYSCKSLYVYTYSPGSAGYKQLNNYILSSYPEILNLRSEGKLPY